jgi:hypothetical protein
VRENRMHGLMREGSCKTALYSTKSPVRINNRYAF